MGRRIKFFDAFCGAGGLSLGLKHSGWKPVGGFDIDPFAAATYETNLEAPVILLDAFDTDPRTFALELDVDCVVGCPPCQGFSKLRVYRFGSDRRNELLGYFLNLVKLVSPSLVMFENVPRVSLSPLFVGLVESLKNWGYDVVWKIVNAADYGVPQKRRRLILLASDCGKLELPEPDHGMPGSPEVEKGERSPWRTLKDVISDLPPLDNGGSYPADPYHIARKLPEHYLRLISAIPKNGGTRFDAPQILWLPAHRRAGKRKFSDVFARLRWEEPSVTITTGFTNPSKGRFVHPEQNRGLTLREGARLQTFPDDFTFIGSFPRIEAQIGEAFPPVLAEKIARSVT